MKIIVSPAKSMKVENDLFSHKSMPVFIDRSEHILENMRKKTLQEMQTLWKCSYNLALRAYENLQTVNLRKNLTPAIFAYEGIQYKYMAPRVMSEKALSYVENNLCILSGFYGLVRAFDGVVPYRLEMQTELNGSFKNSKYKNLYELWHHEVYEELKNIDKDNIIVNLASKEYSVVVEKYLEKNVRFINCTFGELAIDKNGLSKIKVKATKAKMARGAMVRFLAENNISDIEEMKMFGDMGFSYDENLSKNDNLVFIAK